jgi:ParB/RepB/Spo0J family partition protein
MDVLELKTENISDNPDNPRKKLGDISGLMKSIKAIGLQQPITVRKVASNRFIVVAGARRLAACKKLGAATIASIVRTSEETHQLASLAENTAREDLSADEIAEALDRLEGLEMSDLEIAEALAINESAVPAARIVAKASKKHRAAIKHLAPESRQFTLEESASLLRFADNGERMESLADTIEYDPERLPHLLAEYEAEDARIAEIAALRASMRGRAEIDPFNSYQHPPKGVEPLHNLLTGNGKPLTVNRHVACSFKAFILEGILPYDLRPLKLIHYCSDWEAAGHRLSEKPKEIWRAEIERASQEKKSDVDLEQRRKVIRNNKRWSAASTVRTTWIEEYCERKELPQAAKQWVITELLTNPELITRPTFALGTLERAHTFDKGFVIVWRQLAQSRENELARCTWRPSGFQRPVFERYFAMLKSQGYPLSEVEELLLAQKVSE